MVVNRIICLVMGYIFGLFQTGFIYGKLQHIDIREYGSGNAGTTNTLRTLGWKAGLITFFGDAGKAILSMLLAWILWKTCKDSVRYYPAAVCALGAALSIRELERFIHRMDMDYIPQQQRIQLAVCLLPYGVSILLTLLFWGYMRRISGKAV